MKIQAPILPKEDLIVWIVARLEDGHWINLNRHESVFRQPGGSHKGEFALVLKGEPYPQHFKGILSAASVAASRV